MKLSELGPFSLKEGDRGDIKKVPSKSGGVSAVSQGETSDVGKENPDTMKTGRLLNLIEEAQKRMKSKKAKETAHRKKAIEAYLVCDEVEANASALGMRLQIKV